MRTLAKGLLCAATCSSRERVRGHVSLVLRHRVNCNVGTAVLSAPWAIGIGGELINRGTGVGEVTPVSQGLCYAITGTGLLTAVVYFDQY